jgi:hypothetical protein
MIGPTRVHLNATIAAFEVPRQASVRLPPTPLISQRSKTGGRGQRIITAIPARVTITITVQNSADQSALIPKRPIFNSNTHKGPDVNILKGDEIVVKIPEGMHVSPASPTRL